MIEKSDIEKLINTHLEGSSNFLTQVKVSPQNHVEVLIDGDNGVTINDCVQLSRFIESSLNEKNLDFSLDVSSHGATNPLISKRQYPKHIGRDFKIKLEDNSVHEGTLVELNEDTLTLSYKLRENKPVGKGKITVEKTDVIPFHLIKESKIKLKF